MDLNGNERSHIQFRSGSRQSIRDFQFQATASRLSNGHINFAKARNLAQKLKEFAIWKDVESPYAKTPVVAEFLQNSPIWSEKGMLTRAQCYQMELR